ncbi:MAG: hypothetical protein ACI89E_000508 [Planctomycetota bacterium]|jgi:hypothetical protein
MLNREPQRIIETLGTDEVTWAYMGTNALLLTPSVA